MNQQEWAATLARIDTLRSMGARRVVVDGVEVEFGPRTSPAAAQVETPPTPEEIEATEKAKREEDEQTLYWSSGGDKAAP